ncbi:hypothetical protein [Yersinia rohdei]|uniref:hypothetical protein n=1 Tax=Yersinia rohdei TaxID=29485 RepID=UPI0025AB01FE|nr:hypothetical protein [Yersinia rohdei]MDN0096229.1 hypothetical protein [Yersinia rohdei]
MLSKEELQEMTVVYGNSHNACMAAKELLSLREQFAELKAWATNRAITDDARENENYTTLKIDYRLRELRELLKAAKPAED